MSKDYLSIKAADMIRSSIINADLQIGESLSEHKISDLPPLSGPS